MEPLSRSASLLVREVGDTQLLVCFLNYEVLKISNGTAPVYCSELAPPSVRGFFVGMIGAMLGLGYATANYFGLAFYYASDPTVSWRAPLGLQLFFPLMILCLLPFVPESPRYFLMTDKKEQAWSVIEKLHEDPTDPGNEFARREFYQMAQQAAYDRTVNSSWIELFRRPSYRKRVLFGMFLMILCQSTGELVLNQYVCPPTRSR